jgi:hypothetical protein
MSARVYDCCMAFGIACCSAGAYVLGGAGPALITLGSMVIAATIFAVVAGKA